MLKLILSFTLFVNLLWSSEINRGALFCNNADTVRKIVYLSNYGEVGSVVSYFEQMQSLGICNRINPAIKNLEAVGREDLSGGVTRIGGRFYIVTQDIRN